MKKNRTIKKQERKTRTVSFNPLKPFWDALTPHVRQGIQAVFFVTGGILFLLSLGGAAGRAGDTISQGLSLLFGAAKYVFPVFLILWGGALFRYRNEYRLSWVAVFGAILFLFSFTAFWHLRFLPEESYKLAQAGEGGGLVGFFLGYSLTSILGFWGTLLVLVALCISSLLIILNISLEVLLGEVVRVWAFFVQSVSRAVFKNKETHYEEESAISSFPPVPDFSKKEVERKEEIPTGSRAAPLEAKGENGSIQILAPKVKRKIQLSLDLLESINSQPTSGDIRANKIVIQKTLENFGIPVEMGEVHVGPTVTQFTLKPADGVKLSSILALHNDLALSLAAHPVRIEAPIPGKSLVGVEVPNQKIARVSMKEALESEEFRKRGSNLSVILGKDVSGHVRIAQIASMPHMLIAGSTGSGKTVSINSLIISLLFQNNADELRFIMVDPKRVELPCYNGIPHLLTPVITDVKKAIHALKWTIAEMDRRFDMLSKAGKRDLASYNTSGAEKIPYIVVIIDELADIMVTAGTEAESLIIRLAQMSRAVGIHLVLATQRPSVDVITGLIKANITARIAFAVASQMDSRTILDTAGAEKLVGRGDMLFISSELSKPVRLQGVFVSDLEIERIVKILKENTEASYDEGITSYKTDMSSTGEFGAPDDDDPLLPDAREVIIQASKASASLLQRRLKVGYARAARMLDLLEAQGFIGPADGAKPREILSMEVSDDFAARQDQELSS